jgi:pyruvate carboxylase
LILVANRSEIAIRVMRAASEMRMRTVAIYSQQDRQTLDRFKADESYLVGESQKPLAAYFDGEDTCALRARPGSMPSTPATAFCPRPGIRRRRDQRRPALGRATPGGYPRILGNKVAAAREAFAAFGNDEAHVEKLIPALLGAGRRVPTRCQW